jgi:hypothetical protein
LLFSVTHSFYLLSVLGGIHSACLADGKGEGCDIYCGLLQISASSTLHEKFKVLHHVVARQQLTEKWLDSPRKQRYTVKKVHKFPVSSRDVTNQTPPGQE